jgi:hypothetical protein
VPGRVVEAAGQAREVAERERDGGAMPRVAGALETVARLLERGRGAIPRAHLGLEHAEVLEPVAEDVERAVTARDADRLGELRAGGFPLAEPRADEAQVVLRGGDAILGAEAAVARARLLVADPRRAQVAAAQLDQPEADERLGGKPRVAVDLRQGEAAAGARERFLVASEADEDAGAFDQERGARAGRTETAVLVESGGEQGMRFLDLAGIDEGRSPAARGGRGRTPTRRRASRDRRRPAGRRVTCLRSFPEFGLCGVRSWRARRRQRRMKVRWESPFSQTMNPVADFASWRSARWWWSRYDRPRRGCWDHRAGGSVRDR